MKVFHERSWSGASPAWLLPVLACAAIFFAAASPAAQEKTSPARLTYTKVLRGSVPEYLSVSVDSNGHGTYEGRKLDDPPSPRRLKLLHSTTDRLFELAAELNHFRSVELESHKKVANLGQKSLSYESETEKNRVEFNYTLLREAQELGDYFQNTARGGRHMCLSGH